MTEASKQRPPRFLLQMRADLRHDLDKAAIANGRTLTAEINARLRESFKEAAMPPQTTIRNHGTVIYSPTPEPSVVKTSDNGLVNSDLDAALLQVFRAMPVEKQLALLSLFK